MRAEKNPVEPGRVFGKWTVVGLAERGPGGHIRYACRCECGVEKIVIKDHLTGGRSTSCGCPSIREAELTGAVFGRLTALRVAEDRTPEGRRKWVCRCECGVEKSISRKALVAGLTRSCGCLQRQVVGELATRHGISDTRLYWVLHGIKQRCTNPNDKRYGDYGGRGITVCAEWVSDPAAFVNYMGARPSRQHSVDRIDNDRGYEPGNVRWATPKEQARNKRNNRLFQLNGREMTAPECAEETGLKSGTIRARVDRSGWTPDAALTAPVHVTSVLRIKTITYLGREITMAEAIRLSGAKRATLRMRMVNLGWSAERAIETPVRVIQRHPA